MGSLCDPPAIPGLAHFTEHMLFYASAKYPDEDAYSKFLVRYLAAYLQKCIWVVAPVTAPHCWTSLHSSRRHSVTSINV